MVSESDILSANVLLVDDEEANVLLLRRTLSAARYVSIASTVNPREVLELHRKNRYDLIVLDLQMHGNAVASALRFYRDQRARDVGTLDDLEAALARFPDDMEGNRQAAHIR